VWLVVNFDSYKRRGLVKCSRLCYRHSNHMQSTPGVLVLIWMHSVLIWMHGVHMSIHVCNLQRPAKEVHIHGGGPL
jgi:hypothetical protein